ncbi:homocitrate synthase [Mycobacterium sp. CBMA 234]|uniref:homocitrate synthase n=1 Tax=Mycolicibacterium sp. CBMA 234 TaxID=1918495 RepID=UPI0012DDBF7F|nr:homocitrate synthase [Mycolicibacterium sp. CBMA 234]MUL63724.1 homocitrate synthase [Mycolicibacterium sp. CBMA 234]
MSTSTISTAIPTESRFADLFDLPLPRDLREHAETMCHDTFIDHYGHQQGPIRLGRWEAQGRSIRGVGAYQATLAVGACIATSTAAATGPVAALTAMLHERGMAVEMIKFHQLPAIGGGIATFIRGTDGVRAEWAMGWARDPLESALRAVVACANRLSA